MGAPGIERTPCGRVPNTPLRNPRHEIIVHATVCGKNARAAGVEAGYRDGSALDGNVTRILRRPKVQERLLEVAASSANLAGIHDAWVLNDIKNGAKASIAHFWRRDSEGHLVFDESGYPILDLRHATEDQMRTISEMSIGKYGPKLKIHDPKGFLEMLARHRGLFKDHQLPMSTLPNTPIEIRLVKPEGGGVDS